MRYISTRRSLLGHLDSGLLSSNSVSTGRFLLFPQISLLLGQGATIQFRTSTAGKNPDTGNFSAVQVMTAHTNDARRFPQSIDLPGAWAGCQYFDETEYVYQLSMLEVREIKNALLQFKSTSVFFLPPSSHSYRITPG
jgi:hypothetical protein